MKLRAPELEAQTDILEAIDVAQVCEAADFSNINCVTQLIVCKQIILTCYKM